MLGGGLNTGGYCKMYIQTCMHTHVHAAKCSYTNACIHLHPGMKSLKSKQSISMNKKCHSHVTNAPKGICLAQDTFEEC